MVICKMAAPVTGTTLRTTGPVLADLVYVCMYVCMVIIYSKSMDQPGKVANPARRPAEQGKLKVSCPRTRLRIWSREMDSAVPSRVSLLISILRMNLVLAYRWRSLSNVRRHRASKPQGSSERVLPWQITMDQLIFASLSHTHYW